MHVYYIASAFDVVGNNHCIYRKFYRYPETTSWLVKVRARLTHRWKWNLALWILRKPREKPSNQGGKDPTSVFLHVIQATQALVYERGLF